MIFVYLFVYWKKVVDNNEFSKVIGNNGFYLRFNKSDIKSTEKITLNLQAKAIKLHSMRTALIYILICCEFFSIQAQKLSGSESPYIWAGDSTITLTANSINSGKTFDVFIISETIGHKYSVNALSGLKGVSVVFPLRMSPIFKWSMDR